MIESEIENRDRVLFDESQTRKMSKYDEVNQILNESQAVERWIRYIRGKPKTKLYAFRAWFCWLKVNEPELYALKPDGLVQYQKRTRGTDDEFVIHDERT